MARQAHTESTRDRKRRQRTSARADRLFARQYASEASGSAPDEGAPRAALYKGKMGSSQRRSVRMQSSSDASPVSAKINPAGWFSGLNLSARSLKLGTAVVCFLLAIVFLYTPAQQFYQAQRENSRLTAEYSVLEQRNEAIDAQNDTLASDAGMEDAVRQKYGYIRQGDQVAIVSGLSDNVVGTARAADNDFIEANVLSSTVKAPEEWYTPILDAFFGYE
ncbi:MAG: septum formation initiator family protein [Eggerthellaceae bacterium]|nr:septum formation initiator family protein [Eggerthellaceae bacterium]